MDDLSSDIQQESMDELGNLSFSPPPMKKSDTRDSISSVDSDVSLSFDRRGSKGEEADLSDCASGPDDIQRFSDSQTQCDAGKFENKLTESSTNTETRRDDEIVAVSDDLAVKICDQVEFYFSNENIVKDAFLLKHVKRNKDGYVSLKLISSFKRVKHLSRDWRVVGTALKAKSKKLQVNEQGTKLRRLDPLPQYDQTLPSRSIIAARLPVDKLTIESVAEIFRQCGEIALIRILKPGHPVPAEIRQAIAKKSELGNDEECALIEFTDSASARSAIQLSLGDAKLYELQQTSSGDKRRKQSSQQSNQSQQGQMAKKLIGNRNGVKQNIYNSSSCPSGSEEEIRSSRAGRVSKGHQNNLKIGFPTSGSHSVPYQGPPSPDVWLPRRFSACVIGTDQLDTSLMRRLSGSSSDTTSYSSYPRRFSTCSSGSDGGYTSPVFHNGHQSSHSLYPSINCWPNQSRRYSCCSTSQSTQSNYGFNYANSNGFYQPTRRGSTDCGPFLRRLSNCSRDSGYDGRRLSSCSSSSESCGFRSRSNSGFVLMAHLPENITRMPSGPDGTKGFGRNNNNIESSNNSTAQTCG